MIHVKLLKLANDLDAAGLTKEADIADRLAKKALDEWDDTASQTPFDSMDEAAVEAFGEEPLEEGLPGEEPLAGESGGDLEAEATEKVKDLLAGVQALKDMIDEGWGGPEEKAQLAQLEPIVQSLQQLHLGGDVYSEMRGEEPKPYTAWGVEGLSGEPGSSPVAEAMLTIDELLKSAEKKTVVAAADPAREQQDFYKRYIALGEQSPFYDNAEGFGLPYEVTEGQAKNYQFAFKLDTNAKPVPGSVVAEPSGGKQENPGLTAKHKESLEEIVAGIDWPSQYPGISQYAGQYSALSLGPFEWQGEIAYTGGEIDFDV